MSNDSHWRRSKENKNERLLDGAGSVWCFAMGTALFCVCVCLVFQKNENMIFRQYSAGFSQIDYVPLSSHYLFIWMQDEKCNTQCDEQTTATSQSKTITDEMHFVPVSGRPETGWGKNLNFSRKLNVNANSLGFFMEGWLWYRL